MRIKGSLALYAKNDATIRSLKHTAYGVWRSSQEVGDKGTSYYAIEDLFARDNECHFFKSHFAHVR